MAPAAATDAERTQPPRLRRPRPETGYSAQRTPLAQSVVRAVQTTVVQPLVLLTSGGGLPLHVFQQERHTLTIPTANYDNNQHAEYENLHLGNL